MTSDLQKKRAIFGVAALVVILLDQWSKYVVRLNPDLHYKDLIEGWLAFHYVSNPGMALGIDLFDTLTISIIATVATIGIGIYVFRTMNDAHIGYSLIMGLILGGAIGNLIDRAYLGLAQGYGGFMEGHVTDFIHFTLRIYDFAVFPYIFNVADMCISVSVIVFLIFHKKLVPQTEKTTKEASPLSVKPAKPENKAVGTDSE